MVRLGEQPLSLRQRVSDVRLPLMALLQNGVCAGKMDADIVHSVTEIEAEADRIIAEAGEHARQLAESMPSEIETLTAENEQELEGRLGSLRAELGRKTSAELARIEKGAARAAQELESLAQEAVQRAIATVAGHLRGGGVCP